MRSLRMATRESRRRWSRDRPPCDWSGGFELPSMIRNRWMSNRRLVAAALLTASLPSVVIAQGRTPDLGRISLEDLLNIEITSAARKEQRVADTAAAVYVITQEDIRRSGMTTLPDVLRL